MRSLLSQLSRLNELLRVVYRINRQIVKSKSFEEVLADVVRELSSLGECFLSFDEERSCVRRAIESGKVVREHSEDCKFYEKHSEKSVIAAPIEIDSRIGALVLISEKLSESEFELIEALIDDVKFARVS